MPPFNVPAPPRPHRLPADPRPGTTTLFNVILCLSDPLFIRGPLLFCRHGKRGSSWDKHARCQGCQCDATDLTHPSCVFQRTGPNAQSSNLLARFEGVPWGNTRLARTQLSQCPSVNRPDLRAGAALRQGTVNHRIVERARPKQPLPISGLISSAQ